MEYERLADAKKAEHQLQYPNYRFQPMKKEEKERIREEKKAAQGTRSREEENSRSRKRGCWLLAGAAPSSHTAADANARARTTSRNRSCTSLPSSWCHACPGRSPAHPSSQLQLPRSGNAVWTRGSITTLVSCAVADSFINL
jgi:hypothetical protein